nr:PEPxxWA-CTERM sorting domain-containing protein [Sphingomonas sp. Leaf412]
MAARSSRSTSRYVTGAIVALSGACLASPVVAQKTLPPPPPMPSTVSTVRCFAGEAMAARTGNACWGAVDDNGDPVGPYNSVTASYNSPYDIRIDVQSGRTMESGPDEAAGAGSTRFAVGFQLLKDLPADFDYVEDGVIPLLVTSRTTFRYSTWAIPGIENPTGYPVNRDLSAAAFTAYVTDRSHDRFGEVVPGELLTDRLVTHGGMTDNWRNYYGLDDVYDENDDLVYLGLDGGSIIAGFTDIAFYDLVQRRTLLSEYGGYDYGVTTVRYAEEFFSKAGDFFVVEGWKGAACLMDMYQENGRCQLDFDPVVTFDQAAFDRRMGARTFDLSEYFGLTMSTGAVPEPGTWGLMILGFAAVGGAMRGRRRRGAAMRIA